LGLVITDWVSEEINGSRKSIRHRNHSISEDHRDLRVSLTSDAETSIHVSCAVTSKCMHHRASLWYINYTSIKLFNKTGPVPAVLEVMIVGHMVIN
jgi:hypothetical protein